MTITGLTGSYRTFTGHAPGIGGVRQGYFVEPQGGSIFVAGGSDIRRETLVERLVARRRAPGEDAVAAGCAGAPSNFTRDQQSATNRTKITVTWPSNADEPQNEDAPRYEELGAIVREVRVPGEDGVSFVDLLARNSSRLRRADGSEFWIDWLQDLTDQPRAT